MLALGQIVGDLASASVLGMRKHTEAHDLGSGNPPVVAEGLRLTSVRQFDNYETVSTETGTRHRLAPGQFELIAKALADPRRVGVLEAIADEQCCACQHLRDQFPVSKATISHHIKELVRAGLVEARREGQFLNVLVRRETLEAYTAELLRRVGGDPTSVTKSKS